VTLLLLPEDNQVRPFGTQDLNAVVQINMTCLPENYNHSFYLTLYYRFPKTFIVATSEQKVVGYIMCRMELGFSEIHRFNLVKKGHIVSVAILPGYRRRGLGNAILNKALEGMREYNVKEGYLEVRVSNQPAIDLYTKLGFSISKKSKNYYKDGEDAYIMVKELH
jgi:ribosomal-protein-alanine N-acetyltransferase